MQAASDVAEITRPDGTKVKVSLKDIMNSPKLYKLVSDKPGMVEYKTPEEGTSQVAAAPTAQSTSPKIV